MDRVKVYSKGIVIVRNKKDNVNSRKSNRKRRTKKTPSRDEYRQNFSQDKRKKKLILKSILAAVLVVLIVALSYFSLVLAGAQNLLDSAYTPRKNTTTINGKSVGNLNENIDPIKDPISILVMGIDDNSERKLGSARTDTMMLLTLNPQDGAINMVTIPRDTYTSINTKKFVGYDKINTAYTYGGDEGAIQAVQDLTNVPINYYLTIDFQAFEDIIDALGGIKVNVPMNIHSEYASEENPNAGEIIIHKGEQTLNGKNALIFARIRKIDNDIERGKRQQLVVQKVIEKATEVGSITKYNKVLTALKDHMWTDMKSDTMLSVAQSALKTSYSIHSYVFDWSSFNSDPNGAGTASYVSLNADSLSYISHKFRLALGLDSKDERDAEGYTFKTDGTPSTKTYPSYGAYSDSGE